ncbi:FkbM family methyltransferase [Methylococcus capsulatus]|uniref:FkbM family methyltransferase n=1 Tax=Methylococcus capsulatus TaxID=414 RepID=UPI002FD975AF
MRIVTVCDHSFMPGLLEQGDLILDCGANRGEFSRWCSQNWTNPVLAFEADPRLFPNLPVLENVTFIERAVAAFEGVMGFTLACHRCSSGVLKIPDMDESVEVPTVTLDSFVAARWPQAVIGLMKLDIEGSEIDVLRDISPDFLRRVRQITVEFHDFLDPALTPSVREVSARLQRLGFYLVRFSYYTWGDCLFINQNLNPLTLRQRFMLQAYYRYWRGVRRHIQRGISRILRRLFGSSV